MEKSFSAEVKDEICKSETLTWQAADLVLGFALACSGNFSNSEISIKSSNQEFVERLKSIIDEYLNIDYELNEQKTQTGIIINDPAAIEKTQNFLFDLLSFNYVRGSISRDLSSFTEAEKWSLVRAAFLSTGSIAEPKQNYQLEFSIRRKLVNRFFIELLEDLDVNFLLVSSQSSYDVLYIKNGDELAEFLVKLGATRAFLEFENIRVRKRVNEQVNRAINCDTANIQRIADSAARQINLIKKLNALGAYNNLPLNLREIADLRLENPGLSLSELGNELTQPIGKSGVYHRLARLEKWIEEYLLEHE